MLNVIIVEDNRSLRESLLDVIVNKGHHVAAFESAEAFWSGCSLGTVDVMILDLNLPGEDGLAVARRMRAEHPKVGIVMLTARDEPDDRRIGYETGADIYLAKPSSAPELVASVESLARRLERGGPKSTGLVLDPVAMTLSGSKNNVVLSASEVDLLIEFTRSSNGRLETNHIANLIKLEGEISKASIEVRIVRLRKKLTTAGASGQPITAVRNQGYQLSVRMDIL